MQDEKEKKITTVFKWPASTRVKAKADAKTAGISVSELLSNKLDSLLKSDNPSEVDGIKAEKGSLKNCKPTSVSIPYSLHTAAKVLACKHTCSLADIFRHCLDN